MIDDSPRRPRLVTIGVTAAALLLYAASMTNLLTQDSMTYAVTALRGSVADLLHPHHLIYDLLLAGVLTITDADTPGAGTLQALQALNVLISAAAVGVMFRVLLTLGLSTARALLFTAVLATSNGFWLYSSQIEVYNLAALSCLVALLCYLWRDRSQWVLVGGSVAVVLAMLSHQTALFFAFGLIAQCAVRHRGRERASLLTWLIAIPGVVVAALYVWAAWFVTGQFGLRGIWLFATSYAHTGQWGSVSSKSFLKAPFGFVSAFAQIEGLRLGTLDVLTVAGLVVLAAAVVAATMVAVAAIRASRRRASQSNHELDTRANTGLAPLLYVWLISHSVFVLWWHPSNIEFWILTVPIIVVLIAGMRQSSSASMWQRRAYARFPVLLVAAQLLLNVGGVIGGRSTTSDRDVLARELAADVRDVDLIVVASHPAHVPYIRFYSGATVSFPYAVTEPGTSDTAAIRKSTDDLMIETRRALDRGGNIILVGDPLVIAGSDALRSTEEQETMKSWLNSFDWQSTRMGEVVVRRANTMRRP